MNLQFKIILVRMELSCSHLAVILFSHSSMSQQKPKPKSPEDGQNVVDEVPPTKEALSPPQRLASGNDVIYISDDAASDMSDASDDEATDETLPSVQAIMHSVVEERGIIDSTSTWHAISGGCQC